MGTIIVGAVLLAIITVAVASMARDKKNGKSISCGGDCSHCAGHCNVESSEQQKNHQDME